MPDMNITQSIWLHQARAKYQRVSAGLALLRRMGYERDFGIRFMEGQVKLALDELWEAQGRKSMRNGRAE